MDADDTLQADPVSDPAPDAHAIGSAPFDNVDLGDTPHIDLSFSGDGPLNRIEPKMDFLDFGTSWNTPPLLDTYNNNTTTNHFTDTFNHTAMDEGNSWGFSETKKKKKQTTTSAFDFGNYDTHENLESHSKPDETKDVVKEIWGGAATSAGKKDKKGKKKGGADEFFDEPAGTVTEAATAEPLNKVEDTITPFVAASGKKDKKKAKKASLDASIGELPSLSPASPPIEPAGEQEWASFGIAKDKKKGKKGLISEPEKKDELAVTFGADPYNDLDFGWGLPEKDKKMSKKEEPAVVVVSPPELEEEVDKESGWGHGSKKTKKAKKGVGEEVTSPKEPIASEPAFEDLGGWDVGFKKDKKKGKWTDPEEVEQKEQKEQRESLIMDTYDPDPSADTPWGALGTKKDKKKGKKDTLLEPTAVEDSNAVEVPEPQPMIEDTFLSFGKKKDKKFKKGVSEVRDDPVMVIDSTAATAATNIIADTSWTDWGSADKKKDKKGKKGNDILEANQISIPPPPPPPPEVSEVPEPYSLGGWGAPTKNKKGKNSKTIEPEAPLNSISNPITNFLADDNGGNWSGSWGFSGKDKKKKEEQEQEQKEREKREEEERREAERQEAEEEKERQTAEEKEKSKEKVKVGKKSKLNATVIASKTKEPMAESKTEVVPGTEDDTWGTWGASKAKDKKKGGRKDAVLDPPPPAPTPPAQGLTPEPTPEPYAEAIPGFDDFHANSWGTAAPAKAKGKKDGKKGAKAEEPKIDAKVMRDGTGDSAFDFLQDNDQDGWGKDDGGEEESPAKAAKGFWSVGAGSTTKAKTWKEKDKAAAEAKKVEETAANLIDLNLNLEDNALMEFLDEPASKSVKTKPGSKFSSGATKEGDKWSKLGDKNPKKGGWNVADTWGKAAATAAAELTADALVVGDDENSNTAANAKADGWSFFGAKKTSGNSGQSGLSGKLADQPKREITKQGLANQKDSLDSQLDSFSKEPEPSWLDDQAEPSKSSKSTKSPMSSTKPVTKVSSVAARVKALEKDKDKGKTPEPTPSPPVKNLEPLSNAQPPKKSAAAVKLKAASAAKNASWDKKGWSSPAAEEDKEAEDSVPGSFPAEGADDDIIDLITVPAAKKSSKKNAKPKKAPVMDPVDLMDLEDVPEFETSPRLGGWPKAQPPPPPPAPEVPPTPPPEPAASKPAKKERARVVRDEGAPSWGFWGASPKKAVKKEVKAKDDADLPSPLSKEKPGLARSKTTKVGREKEIEKSSGKSSGSDKEKKLESRPAKPRGSSFGGFFGGPPPVRAKPIRRSSVVTPKNASRRQSMDIDASGLPSPPVEDAPGMSSKAAKVMGASSGKLGRKESVREKPKASGKHGLRSRARGQVEANRGHVAVPDPYPIDDDDMVLVNGLENPVINAPIPKIRDKKERSSKTKPGREVRSTLVAHNVHASSKRSTAKPQAETVAKYADDVIDSKQTKRNPDAADDVVMVEAGPSNDGSGSPVAPDDLAFPVERPKPLQRSSTSAKRAGNSKLMGLFGGFQKSRRMSETYERTRSKNAGDDDEGHAARKRTAAGDDDGAKRIRRDDRRIRASERPDVTITGLTMDPLKYDEGVPLESGNSESKREDRRAARASRGATSNGVKEPEIRDGQDRKLKRRESERPRDEGQEKGRSSRERRTRKEEDVIADADAARHEERRVKRAAREDRAPQDLGFDIPERRSKHREREAPEVSGRNGESSSRPHRSDHRRSHMDHPISPSREPERRPHRSRRATGERSSHRKSTAPAPAVGEEDYFNSRNGPSAPGEGLPADLPPPLTQESHEPYMHGANDHTSSWVKSQISEPAPPPPVEPSVLDPTPVGGGPTAVAGDDEAEQEARRAARKREKRRSKYGGGGEEEDEADGRRRRRPTREGVKSSEGSGDGDRDRDRDRNRDRDRERRKSEYVGREGRDLGGIGFGGGTGLGGKRGSWFKKIGLQI